MTVKSLFTLVLKIVGLLFLKDILSLSSQVITIVFFANNNSTDNTSITLLLTTLLLFSHLLVAFLLVFKSDIIIEKLQLTQGFDQDPLPLNVHRSTILSIAVIVTGGLLALDEIPNTFRLLYSYFVTRSRFIYSGSENFTVIFVSVIKIAIGLLLIKQQRQIVNFIELKRKQ